VKGERKVTRWTVVVKVAVRARRESKRTREGGRERAGDRAKKREVGRGRRRSREGVGGGRGGGRTIEGEGDSAKGVDLPSVSSPIILSSRVSLTNVARSSDPSAIHDDVRRGRPGDGRASTATPDERQPARLSREIEHVALERVPGALTCDHPRGTAGERTRRARSRRISFNRRPVDGYADTRTDPRSGRENVE